MCQFVSRENVSQSMSDTHQPDLMVLVAYSIYIFQSQKVNSFKIVLLQGSFVYSEVNARRLGYQTSSCGIVQLNTPLQNKRGSQSAVKV